MNPIQHASFCETCGGVLEADSDSWNKESKEICLTLFIALIWVIEKKRKMYSEYTILLKYSIIIFLYFEQCVALKLNISKILKNNFTKFNQIIIFSFSIWNSQYIFKNILECIF